jgi:trehalose 6-phosphate phosphatase
VLGGHRTAPPGFELLEGKAVVELRPAGVDKGRALSFIADRLPTRPPLVLGDDVTDEDAFEEAERRGGASILVADRSSRYRGSLAVARPRRGRRVPPGADRPRPGRRTPWLDRR